MLAATERAKAKQKHQRGRCKATEPALDDLEAKPLNLLHSKWQVVKRTSFAYLELIQDTSPGITARPWLGTVHKPKALGIVCQPSAAPAQG